MQWARIWGIITIRVKNRDRWASWEEIVSIFNYVKHELEIEPVTVKIINLANDMMIVEIYGVLRTNMYEEVRERLDQIIRHLSQLYAVTLNWNTEA